MSSFYKYVVLGGGTAAGYAANSENSLPYERPALSKGYLHPKAPARLPAFLTCVGTGQVAQDQDWYDSNEIEVKLNSKVVQANLSAKKLILESGSTIEYEKLVIATGVRPRTLTESNISITVEEQSQKNVFYLRDISQADKLYNAIQQDTNKTCIVLGGGFIAFEVAAALAQNNVQVTMIFSSDHLLPSFFTKELANFYEQYYTSTKKIRIVPSTQVKTIVYNDSSGKFEKIIVEDGKDYCADMLVVGLGSTPNAELFDEQLQLTSDKHILVNEKLQTNVEDVFAIGDVVNFPNQFYDNGISKLEHVDNARKMASHVMKSILEPEFNDVYSYVPFFYSRVFGFSWQIYGNVSEECVHFKQSNGNPGAFWLKDDVVCGAYLESGTDKQNKELRRFVSGKIVASDIEKLKGELEFAAKL